MNVRNMTGKGGRAVPNQFLIENWERIQDTDGTWQCVQISWFQSYETMIARMYDIQGRHVVELDKHAHLLVSPVVVLGDSLELQCCRLRITAIAVSAGSTLLTDRRGLGRHRWRISRAMAASSRKKFNGDG